jgi:hypothetical protein
MPPLARYGWICHVCKHFNPERTDIRYVITYRTLTCGHASDYKKRYSSGCAACIEVAILPAGRSLALGAIHRPGRVTCETIGWVCLECMTAHEYPEPYGSGEEKVYGLCGLRNEVQWVHAVRFEDK